MKKVRSATKCRTIEKTKKPEKKKETNVNGGEYVK